MKAERLDVASAMIVGWLLRAALVLWGAPRFPPAADGYFYHVLASRMASGQGYTWAWPDGAITHAAHYPVGYPALVAGAYRVFGHEPAVAMGLGALLGGVAVLAAHRLARTVASRSGARLAAWAVALHPALVLYTPAVMTEGFVASLLLIASWVAVETRRARRGWFGVAALGAVFAVITLVRPQCILLAPVFGLAASRGRRWALLLRPVVVSALALALVMPWTARNCTLMGRCVLVSANGGWNLLIGAMPGATGGYEALVGAAVPLPCREVFAEAEKDACFGREARAYITRRPGAWLALAPRKLSETFDGGGSAAWYLRGAGPDALSEPATRQLAALETLAARLLLLLALLGLARDRPRWQQGVAGAAAAALLTPWATIGYLGLVALVALRGRRALEHPPALLAAATIAATALTHAVFFGAARYSMVVFGLVAALAGCILTPRRPSGDTAGPQLENSDAADRD